MLNPKRWSESLTLCCWNHLWHRVDSRFAPSQWDTSIQSNAVSHWLGANLESTLLVKHAPSIGQFYLVTKLHRCWNHMGVWHNSVLLSGYNVTIKCNIDIWSKNNGRYGPFQERSNKCIPITVKLHEHQSSQTTGNLSVYSTACSVMWSFDVFSGARESKKTSTLRITGLYEGNPYIDGQWIRAQKVSYPEGMSYGIFGNCLFWGAPKLMPDHQR